MKRYTFKKNERLVNKQTLEEIFSSGKNISADSFRLLWISKPQTTISPVEVVISVPKKSFSKSVQRNRIKRRIREAYRKNKHSLYEFLEKKNLSIALMIIYSAKEELAYKEIEQKMIVSLQKLIEKLQ
ncbi:MAG: ribonuclease P protein component [Bacteroidetes bacterium]|nr:ribonuclease P protein component [Bacteroidota bacterium]